MNSAEKTSAKKQSAANAGKGAKKASQHDMNDKIATTSAKDTSAPPASAGDTGVNAIRAAFLDFFARNDHRGRGSKHHAA